MGVAGLIVAAILLLVGAVVFGVLWNGKKSSEIAPSGSSKKAGRIQGRTGGEN